VIVVDSTAVLDALTCPQGSEALRGVLAAEEVHVPALVDYEVVAGVRALVRAGALSSARGQDVLTDLDDLPLWRWEPADPLRRRALQLSTTMSAEGAACVALAQALGCPLVTRRPELGRAAGHLVPVTVA
jgi:predicted nucleic acid-binding protein